MIVAWAGRGRAMDQFRISLSYMWQRPRLQPMLTDRKSISKHVLLWEPSTHKADCLGAFVFFEITCLQSFIFHYVVVFVILQKCAHFLDKKTKVQDDQVLVPRLHFRKDMKPEVKSRSFNDLAHLSLTLCSTQCKNWDLFSIFFSTCQVRVCPSTSCSHGEPSRRSAYASFYVLIFFSDSDVDYDSLLPLVLT